jgi:lysophospholipase L1-like esterase
MTRRRLLAAMFAPRPRSGFALLAPAGPLVTAHDRGAPYLDAPDPRLANPDTLPWLGCRGVLATVEATLAPGAGLELGLMRRPDVLPLRARLQPDRLSLHYRDATPLAERELSVAAGRRVTLRLLLYEKGVFADAAGVEARIEDRQFVIPGAVALIADPRAEVRNWRVTPVGPLRPAVGAIGDSITAGLRGAPNRECYVALVAHALGDEYTLNAGSGGATTEMDVRRFPYEIAPFEARTLWIEGGTNDLARGRSPDRVLESMLAEAALARWGARVVLSTVPPRNGRHAEERARLNRLIRAAGFPTVDRERILADPGAPDRLRERFDSGDGLHPNAAGCAALAEEAWPAFGPGRPTKKP